ncbi:MAG: hypothetical protein ACKO7W_18345 [Elainella sp.]
MLEVFQKLLGTTELDWGQPQQEAMVDLLLLGMYSDNLISLAENEFLETEATQLTWESGISFGGYLQRTIPKVRTAKASPEAKTAFLNDIMTRLGGPEAQQKALEALNALLAADGLVQLEEVFLAEVKQAMGAA